MKVMKKKMNEWRNNNDNNERMIIWNNENEIIKWNMKY